MQNINSIAVIILTMMFLLMLGGAGSDSATMDELAHIPAGFGYVTQFDYRLNPEHPPLIKVISALSGYIFAKPQFPTDTTYWQNDVNGQWAQGTAFLYESGNNADEIIFWSRLPLMLLAVIFGAFLFAWTKKHFSQTTALLTLIFFAFSPTFLAHSKYVTTDLGASIGFFIALITFVKFIETPNIRNLILAGITFGISLLLKFSLILLIPVYGILILAWIYVQPHLHLHERISMFFRLAGKTLIIGFTALALTWIAYTPFVLNYPEQRQIRDTEFILGSFPIKPLADFNIMLAQNSLARPLAQYMLGALMATQRAGGGNDNYFLGEVSATGSAIYFPLLYLLKEHLTLHILTIIAIILAFKKALLAKPKGSEKRLNLARGWIHNHFTEFSSLVFIATYWLSSITSPLNIGVRHVMPTFPFIYLLVSRQIVDWFKAHKFTNPSTILDVFKNLYQLYIASAPKYALVFFLFAWLIIDMTFLTYPHYLSYYNGFFANTKNGYKIAVDSNYDWGQDLLRLRDFVEENKIEKISLDYFGGGNPQYYLGYKFEPWRSSRGPASGWFAISATFRQNAYGTPVKGFKRLKENSYDWLKKYDPVSRAGQSIFIYKLP